MLAKRIGFLIYSGVQALDVVGPMDAFEAVRINVDGQAQPGYDLLTFSLDETCVACESGLRIMPDYLADSLPPIDTLVIPGGRAVRDPEIGAKIGAWIKDNQTSFRRVAAVCTGAFALAEAGLLDGRRVTTHWNYARDLAARFPKPHIVPDALFLKDGAFYSSAGVTAGIDLALALIEEDYGPSIALEAARALVVYMRRTGGQAQFSAPLRLQASSPDRLADVASHIANNLSGDLSAGALAARAHLSVRQFARRFNSAFGMPPAAFVEATRLDEARRLLTSKPLTIDQLAHVVGFASPHALRRAFQRRFGVAPHIYRATFSATALSPEVTSLEKASVGGQNS